MSDIGTQYITFDNVKVPVENTLGPENDGLRVILSSSPLPSPLVHSFPLTIQSLVDFNHERWVMCCGSARSQRLVVEECLTWANQRVVFGKPLMGQAVVRNKLAGMIARTEAAQGWLENVTHQMNNMVRSREV